jgi:hypothetical protein
VLFSEVSHLGKREEIVLKFTTETSSKEVRNKFETSSKQVRRKFSMTRILVATTDGNT